MGQQLYENPIPPLVHIDNGVCKICMELGLQLNRDKDMFKRITDHADEEQSIKDAIQNFSSASLQISKLEVELEILAEQKAQARRGTKKHYDPIIKPIKSALTQEK